MQNPHETVFIFHFPDYFNKAVVFEGMCIPAPKKENHPQELEDISKSLDQLNQYQNCKFYFTRYEPNLYPRQDFDLFSWWNLSKERQLEDFIEELGDQQYHLFDTNDHSIDVLKSVFTLAEESLERINHSKDTFFGNKTHHYTGRNLENKTSPQPKALIDKLHEAIFRKNFNEAICELQNREYDQERIDYIEHYSKTHSIINRLPNSPNDYLPYFLKEYALIRLEVILNEDQIEEIARTLKEFKTLADKAYAKNLTLTFFETQYNWLTDAKIMSHLNDINYLGDGEIYCLYEKLECFDKNALELKWANLPHKSRANLLAEINEEISSNVRALADEIRSNMSPS